MLKTEMRNPYTTHFDRRSSAEQVAAMCRENQNAVLAVEKAAPEIAKAVDAVAAAFHNGHRLFFIGAGTSGRLGVLDAAECPPTFGASPDMVQGIIAGGMERMFSASEIDNDLKQVDKTIREYYGIENKEETKWETSENTSHGSWSSACSCPCCPRWRFAQKQKRRVMPWF